MQSFTEHELTVKSSQELIDIIKGMQQSSQPMSLPNSTNRQHHRQFNPRPLAAYIKHLVIGTSRVRDMYARNIGFNCAIHTYSGATLNELTEVVQKYEGKQLHSVTIIAGFNDAASKQDDAEFKSLWDNLAQSVVSKFSPKSLIMPDTIPSTKPDILDRISLIQTSLQSLSMDNEKIKDTNFYNPQLNSMFSIRKNTGSAFFARDGIHLSAIGTNLLTAFLAGFIRSLHVLSNEDKTELNNLRNTRNNLPRHIPPRFNTPRNTLNSQPNVNQQHLANNRLSHYNRFTRNQNNLQRGNDS